MSRNTNCSQIQHGLLCHTFLPALTMPRALHQQMELLCLCFQTTFLGTQHFPIFTAFFFFFSPTLLNRLSPPLSLCHLKICYIK